MELICSKFECKTAASSAKSAIAPSKKERGVWLSLHLKELKGILLKFALKESLVSILTFVNHKCCCFSKEARVFEQSLFFSSTQPQKADVRS